jgi:hypothetical protein
MKDSGIVNVIAFATAVEFLALVASLDLLNLSTGPVLTASSPSLNGFWSSALTVAEYILFVMVVTSVIALLRHRRRFVIWLFGSFMMVTTFSLVLVLGLYYLGLFSLIPAAAAAGYVWWVIHNRRHSLVIPATISVGVAALWVTSEPFYFVLLLPLGLGLYDVYAVFKGPLKTLVGKPSQPTSDPAPLQEEAEPSHEFSFIDVAATRIGGHYLGFGDTVIYSLMSAFAFVYFGVVPAILTMAALNVGLVSTLMLLKRRGGPLPALPISVALGFVVILAAWIGVI